MKKISILFFLLALAFNAGAVTIYYVNVSTGSDSRAGTSWSTCFRTLAKALAAANASTASEVDIWVAAGTYTPVDGVSSIPSDPRDTSFVFTRIGSTGLALKVYGGFRGTETSISARDTTHTTYLDGIISSGNSYHVAVIAGVPATSDSVVIDGFTISNGVASGSSTKSFNGITIDQVNGAGLILTGNSSSKLAIRHCTFYNNSTPGFTVGSAGYAGLGGGAYITSPCLIDGCKFNANSNIPPGYTFSSRNPGFGGGLYVYGTSLVVKNTSFLNNVCLHGSSRYSTGGGGICFDHCVGAQVQNCYFEGNSVANASSSTLFGYGGGIANLYSQTNISSCRFYANASACCASLGYGFGAHGGALANLRSICHVNSCVFDSNSATNGGAVYDSVSADTFNSCTFTIGNVYLEKSTSQFSNCQMSKNAYPSAAIVNSARSNSSFYQCTIDSNSYYGVFNDTSALVLSRCSILGNATGLYTSASNPVVDSCIFDGNQSYSGAGGGVFIADSSITLTRCIFSNNKFVSGLGGAVFAGSSSIYSATNARFNISGNVFLNNAATLGGAIYVDICPTCGDTLVNNLFIGNKSTDTSYGGGAIRVGGSRNYIYNNTFLYDTAKGHGGAIRIEGTGGLTKVANNIFYKCKGAGSTNDTSIVGTGSFSFYNNIYTGTSPHFRDSVHLKGADSTWGTTDDGLELQPCSAGVDGGNNAYVFYGENTDITGQTRVLNTTVDIGAYEAVIIGAIRGVPLMCVGGSVTFTDTTAGGTWSSSDTTILTVSRTGVVHAVSLGTADISYSHSSSCGSRVALYTVTTERSVSALSGHDTVCVGSTIALTDSLSGGTWASTNTSLAGVDDTGLVRAFHFGIDTITYTVTNSCGTTRASRHVVIEAPANPISGTDSICIGSTATYADSTLGGTWGSTNPAIATINSSGLLRALSSGSDTLIYTLRNSCGISASRLHILVERRASAIDPLTDSFCFFSGAAVFSDTVSGGLWTVSSTSVLSVDSLGGFALFHSVGIDTVSYTVTNSCGTSTSSKTVTVVADTVASIVGVGTICVGDTARFTDSTLGGVWTSSNTALASVNAATGTVTGLSAGTVYITYTITNACGTRFSVFRTVVNGPPPAGGLAGSGTVCQSATITLIGATAGGNWISRTPSVATVSSGGVVTGVSSGTVTITYIVSNSCGSDTGTRVISVIAPPLAGSISGTDSLCPGETTTLVNSVSGGTWLSNNTAIATVNSAGVVTGTGTGTVQIKYYVGNACGTDTASHTLYPHDPCTNGIEMLGTQSSELHIFPNPNQGSCVVHLASRSNGNALLTVTNMLDTKVLEQGIATNKDAEVNLNVASGIYYITVSLNGERIVKKLVVE